MEEDISKWPSALNAKPRRSTLKEKAAYILIAVQEMRMTKIQEGHVTILDLRLRCGQKVLEVSLWHDEAYSELYFGDEVELTHLKALLKENGKGKLNSPTYTTIKVHK
ncbi:hypothetical protein Q8A67_000041 [Cirrhinus molitorella]|uniref:Uncharacterized protein n=1 Tax=Cirrhinus molitorella TaxID=172907 RepID=A0AA88TWH7_9TELE|nr:hypothetical protein Q8A67_000041 [Cirrhinus molitorella]